MVKNRGQHCGDIELPGYLTNEAGPVSLVLDLRIVHDRVGSSTDPTLKGHLKYPNNLDQSLNDSVADKIRKYRADYNNSSDICKNQPKRLDFDNTINLSSLIVILATSPFQVVTPSEVLFPPIQVVTRTYPSSSGSSDSFLRFSVCLQVSPSSNRTTGHFGGNQTQTVDLIRSDLGYPGTTQVDTVLPPLKTGEGTHPSCRDDLVETHCLLEPILDYPG